MTAASRVSVLANRAVARAKSRIWRGLTTTTGKPAAARPAATTVSKPPVASSTTKVGVMVLSRLASSSMPSPSRATTKLSPAGRTATSRRSFATSIPTNMDFGSHPCACGLTVRPRRPFGITKSTAEAPRSGTGLPARGAYGLSADTAPPSLRRRGLFLIQGASRSDASRRVGHSTCVAHPSRRALRALLRVRCPCRSNERLEETMKRVLSGIAVAAIAMIGLAQAANADALDDIKKSGKIRIAVDLGVPPYGMTDDKMQPAGSDIETAKALAKDWGVEFVHVSTTGAGRIPALQTGKADLVISSLSVTPERAKVIDFSLGYAVLRTVIAAPKSVALKSLADLDGKTVGTVRGTTHDTQLTREGPKGMKLVRYEDDATETQAFLSGQVDIFSTAEMMVPQIDKKNPARQVELKFVLDNFKLAVGVKKDEKRLVDEVNAWIAANLKNGRLNELNKKYFGDDLPELILKQ